MRSLWLSLLFVLSASTSLAQNNLSDLTRDFGILESCNGVLEDGTEVSFEIRQTAVPTYFDSVLVETQSNDLLSQLTCQKTGNSQGNQVVTTWTCLEYPKAPQAGLKVEISTGGFARKIGTVTLGQMFPLEPQFAGSLVCK